MVGGDTSVKGLEGEDGTGKYKMGQCIKKDKYLVEMNLQDGSGFRFVPLLFP